MKEQLNKGLFAALLVILAMVSAIGILVAFKGDALLFAITNSAQVRAEKAQWDAYVSAYPNE